jgi:hypothetical protein
MDIKPQNLTGLIFAIVPQTTPSKGDFVVLELNEGSVSELYTIYQSLSVGHLKVTQSVLFY